MDLTVYSFNKRENSTKQPTSDGTTKNVLLKDGCSLYNPSFLLKNTSVPTWNYCKWNDYYYYINDITWINADHVWKLDCEIDVLASFKSNINSTTAFVLFSTSTYNNQIPDPRLSTVMNPTINTNSTDSLGSGGTYSLVHSGNDSHPLSLINYEGMKVLTHKIYDQGFMQGLLADPTDYASKMLNNVSDTIGSIIELPYTPENIGGSFSVKLANYDSGVSANGCLPVDGTKETSVTIPWNFSDFRNRSQYSSLLLYLPGYGSAELNADDFVGRTSIPIKYTMSIADGSVEYLVDNKWKFNASCGVKIPFGASSSNLLTGLAGTAGGAVMAGASAFTGNAIGAVAGGISAFNSILSSMSRNSGTTGGSGIGFGNKSTITCTVISHNTNIQPSAMETTYGRPSNSVQTLGNLSGYCQCANASVACHAPAVLKSKINDYLNGGVYLE